MEFLAATKDGIIIYDVLSLEESGEENGFRDWSKGQAAGGTTVKVVAKLPSPENAFGHGWSQDGTLLASVLDDGGLGVYDASDGYKSVIELPKVAPDVGGRSGGVRNQYFSPKNNFIVTIEKWDPQFPENLHVWDLRPGKSGKKLLSTTLKGYTSGALELKLLKWTSDESACIQMEPGKGLLVHPGDLGAEEGDSASAPKLVAERDIANFQVAPAPKDAPNYVACYTPELQGPVANVTIYNLADPSKPTSKTHLPAKVKDCKLLWNFDGSALLALATSDVDETGKSYYGSSYLYWARADGKVKATQICNANDGLVQDVAWSPNKNEFMVIVGMLPAVHSLYDGKTGKLISTLGSLKRNTIKWNPFGRFVAVGGFGTLPGDLDFFDRSSEETISTVRAALTVDCAWAPDGRHFLACTVAPRMNEGNQISIYKYTGERLLQMNYVPEKIEGRHVDTGAGARTKTQALLFAASWRPDGASKYKDRAASPPPQGKRKKGLSDVVETKSTTTTAQAWRPRGADGGGSLVAAMMKGEIAEPAAATKGGWETSGGPPKLEDWEVRKLEKERKKEAERKVQEEKDRLKEKTREIEQAEKDGKKKLKALKLQLEEMEKLKDKDWDELTDEDEQTLELEADVRAEIADLEAKYGSG